jgi:uncharacterized protein (TIGR03382 family)
MNAFARTLALGVAGKAQAAAVVATLASLGMSEKAEAVLMLPGQSAQSYLNLGATLNNRVGWLQQNTIDGQVGYASATFINPYFAITAAHLVGTIYQNGGTFQVGTGGNFISDLGQVVNVAEVITYPGYAGGVSTNSPDIAILRLATPISGITQAQFGTANPGDVVTSGGYGFAFCAGQPTVPRDGFRRGWNAPVRFNPLYGNDVYYNATNFLEGQGVNTIGKVLSGDSGGGVYNSLGQLVGINFGQSGNNLSVGYSSYLDLAQPDVLNWVQSNTIPTPAALTLLGLGALVGSRRRRD